MQPNRINDHELKTIEYLVTVRQGLENLFTLGQRTGPEAAEVRLFQERVLVDFSSGITELYSRVQKLDEKKESDTQKVISVTSYSPIQHEEEFDASIYSMKTNPATRTLLSAIDRESRNSHIHPKVKSKRLETLWNVFDSGLLGPDAMGGNPLQGAVHANDVNTFNRILKRAEELGESTKDKLLNSTEPNYEGNFMHIAVHGKADQTLQRLTQIHPELKFKTNNLNTTPLGYAKFNGNRRLINLLLES